MKELSKDAEAIIRRHKDAYLEVIKKQISNYLHGNKADTCPICALDSHIKAGWPDTRASMCSCCLWKLIEGYICYDWLRKQGKSVNTTFRTMGGALVKKRLDMLEEWREIVEGVDE